MIAAWYDRQGPAADVLQVGELPAAEPGRGEVRIRLRMSGANPGDIKKRQAWLASPMAFPRIVPHSDGAGVIEAAAGREPDCRCCSVRIVHPHRQRHPARPDRDGPRTHGIGQSARADPHLASLVLSRTRWVAALHRPWPRALFRRKGEPQ